MRGSQPCCPETHIYLFFNPTGFLPVPLECKLTVEILLFQIGFASKQFNRQFFLVYPQGTGDNLKAKPLKQVY